MKVANSIIRNKQPEVGSKATIGWGHQDGASTGNLAAERTCN